MAINELSDHTTIMDDVYLKFGTNLDIWQGYDEAGDNRLEWTDAAANVLMALTDSGAVGDLLVTGDISLGGGNIVDTASSVANLTFSGTTKSRAMRLVTTSNGFILDALGSSADDDVDAVFWSEGVEAGRFTGDNHLIVTNNITGGGILTMGSGSVVLTNADGTINLEALEQDGANVGDGMEWDGTDWIPSSTGADSYSSMWYLDATSATTTLTIATQNLLTQFVSFTTVGEEDAGANAVGSVASDDITIGANGGGNYVVHAGMSGDADTGNDVFLIGILKNLATPIAIASSTDATPVVVTTSAAHGLEDGDIVVISAHVDNVIANGNHIIDVTGASTFALYTLAHVAVVGSGAGAGSGGNVDSEIEGGTVRENQFGAGGVVDEMTVSGIVGALAGDTFDVVMANQSGTGNMAVHNLSFDIHRL